MQPLKGLTVVTLEHAIAAPFATRQLADLGARVIKIERPGVGDFARGYDYARARPGLALRLDQPLQGEPDARREASRGRRRCSSDWCSRRPTWWCRTWRPARLRGWASATRCSRRRSRRIIVCDISGYGDERPVSRQEGLRPADPERGGVRVGHRHARRAVQGRPFHRRHRRRHVRLHQHPRGAAAAQLRPDAVSTSTSRCWSRWPNG